MGDIGALIIAVIGLLLMGTLVSLVALVPPIRRWCQRSRQDRIVATCVLGIVSFVISYTLVTRLEAEATFVFGTIVHVDTFDPERAGLTLTLPPEAEANKPQIVRELWIRLLVPPMLRRPCYAREASICDLADDVSSTGGVEWGWGPYLLAVGIASVPVVTSSVLVRLFTRRR